MKRARTGRRFPKPQVAGSSPAGVTSKAAAARSRLAAAFRRAGVPPERVPEYLAHVDHIVDAVMLSGRGVSTREGVA